MHGYRLHVEVDEIPDSLERLVDSFFGRRRHQRLAEVGSLFAKSIPNLLPAKLTHSRQKGDKVRRSLHQQKILLTHGESHEVCVVVCVCVCVCVRVSVCACVCVRPWVRVHVRLLCMAVR